MANTYDTGDQVRFTGTFTNVAGTVIDPDEVFFRIRPAAGTTTIYEYGTDAELERDSTGVYHVDYTITAAGYWYYRFYSTGTGTAAGESHIMVRASVF